VERLEKVSPPPQGGIPFSLEVVVSKTTAYYNQVYNAGYRDGVAASNKAREQSAELDAALAIEGMVYIMSLEKGYYRIGRSQAGDYYCRWKWLEGPHADYYTFYSCGVLAACLNGLHDKALLIAAGKAQPTLDKPVKVNP
jgi:hypothetical protein